MNKDDIEPNETKSRPLTSWHQMPASLNSPSLWLAVFIGILAILFFFLDIQASWDSMILTLVLNTLFVVFPALLIYFIAAWSYIRAGNSLVLWLGMGTLSYGLAVLTGMWTRTWASANASRTVFTLIYLIAGLLFITGAFIAISKNQYPVKGTVRRRGLIAAAGCMCLLALIAGVTAISVKEQLPAFYIPGSGATDAHLLIQGIAIALYILSGLMILTVYRQSGIIFHRWFGLGLLLTVINTIGYLLLKAYGTPFNWILRGAQLLAGVYLLIAALTIWQGAKVNHLPATAALDEIFRHLQARLERSDKKIAEIIDSIQEDFYVLDRDWNFVYASRMFTSRFGKSPEDMVGHNIWQLFPKHRGSVLEDNLRVAMEQREIRRFEVNGKYSPSVYQIAAFPSEEGITVLGTDITEQRNTEIALRESEEHFRALSETSPIGVGVSSADGVVLYTNRSYELVLGYGPAELIGRKVTDVYWDPADRLAWQGAMQQDGVIRYFETRLKSKDGKPVWVSISASPISYRGQQAVMGTIQDIGDRKNAEFALKRYASELEAANKELEAFAYSVSHDLRAPLRTLDGFSQVVLEEYGERLDATGKDYLMRIRGAAQYMARITEDMLKLSRVIRSELRLETFDLSQEVAKLAQELNEREPARKIEFIIARNVVVYGDVSLMQMALNNILDNAWKFTAKSPAARIEFGTVIQGDSTVYFVKDNGVGFDMKYADKLFQPFQRLHADHEFPGTGIGLANVQRVIRRHGGKIWAESEVGAGTSIFFTLGVFEQNHE